MRWKPGNAESPVATHSDCGAVISHRKISIFVIQALFLQFLTCLCRDVHPGRDRCPAWIGCVTYTYTKNQGHKRTRPVLLKSAITHLFVEPPSGRCSPPKSPIQRPEGRSTGGRWGLTDGRTSTLVPAATWVSGVIKRGTCHVSRSFFSRRDRFIIISSSLHDRKRMTKLEIHMSIGLVPTGVPGVGFKQDMADLCGAIRIPRR